MELVPQSLANLLRRLTREPKASGAAFDLPLAKAWRGTAHELDLSRSFHGERTANVLGPAAGPHTQLAQNLALSYLAGGRVMELKTVQILDELEIPRPCIDAANVGFNVEWSQELKIEQARDEYAKGALLIAALRRLGLPPLAQGTDGDYLLDLSLGYDLAGIRSERVSGFVRQMVDAGPTIDRLLAELPPELAAFRDLAPPRRLVSTVTLSTFHGCPAGEIEQIARYVLEELGLHVVVKLNPTLLGQAAVQEVLHEQLGYRELRVREETFAKDLGWEEALAMIARLRRVAHERGLGFGVKLTNTLVVDNHKTFFREKEMYLSGQPLHVLAATLLARLRRALPLREGEAPPVIYSFSAGIDQHNFPLAAAADLYPVTTCTDLLRPGGYARLPRYLEQLEHAMRRVGARRMADYVLLAHGTAEEAMRTVLSTRPVQEEARLLAAARAYRGEHPPEEHLARAGWPGEEARELSALWVAAAGNENAERMARAAAEDPRYRRAANGKTPKKIGSQLALFDCVNCDKCIPVCPNDANFAYTVTPAALEAPVWRVSPAGAEVSARERLHIAEAHQLATFVDACNACGNCDVFCPEDGGPYVMKPHWFGGRTSFEAEQRIDGFYLESRDVITGRHRGAWVRLEVRRAEQELWFSTHALRARLTLGDGRLSLLEHHVDTGEAELRGAWVLELLALLEGVQRTVNPVSAGLSGEPVLR